ncbi:hypothetical protein SK52_03234 [Enterobacter sp. MGH86]|nr:hypothetical protein SK52_03234 [Enterobacter sp. MGH86]
MKAFVFVNDNGAAFSRYKKMRSLRSSYTAYPN